jgi:hypothetical protein
LASGPLASGPLGSGPLGGAPALANDGAPGPDINRAYQRR